jgi:hypothetical protein
MSGSSQIGDIRFAVANGTKPTSRYIRYSGAIGGKADAEKPQSAGSSFECAP